MADTNSANERDTCAEHGQWWCREHVAVLVPKGLVPAEDPLYNGWHMITEEQAKRLLRAEEIRNRMRG